MFRVEGLGRRVSGLGFRVYRIQAVVFRFTVSGELRRGWEGTVCWKWRV